MFKMNHARYFNWTAVALSGLGWRFTVSQAWSWSGSMFSFGPGYDLPGVA